MKFPIITGVVIHGKKLGRTLGFPTANISLKAGLIQDGVYSFKIQIGNNEYLGIGTFREIIELLEVHIFDYNGDLYEQSITVTPIKKIRNNQKFESIDMLQKQIQSDINQVKTLSKFPSLDTIVLETLSLFKNQKELPKLDLSNFKTPLVVGSGNGYYTGRILFRNLGAFFATESEIEQKLKNIDSITDVVVISASGEKHAPIILNTAKEYQKNTCLISSNPKSSGREIADSSIIMPKISEPYTYNTSTYFGYILAENPNIDLQKLEDFILETLTAELEKIDFSQYNGFCIVIPDQFVLIREMFEVKFIELFGRKLGRDVFSYEQMKHATTVVKDEKELFICFGNESGIVYGENQINLPIFDIEHYSSMMLVGYYTIGKIQLAFPPYFMQSIEQYCIDAKTQSGFNISPMVTV
ncbi:hypothetical protein K2X92_02020 [Candidatus Gracilibacteria bacterium]|nr:hypothetical protein [Candidatus Gracilibacteria bacterium]